MEMITSDYKKSIDVGTGDMLQAILSTINVRFPDTAVKISAALKFLETGNAYYKNIPELVNEFNVIISTLKTIGPEQAIYDYKHPKKKAPWANGYYEGITNCADLFTTSDGKILLKEILNLLNYAATNNLSISFM